MPYISKHNTKQEWESNYIKGSWINFLIRRNTVGYNDLMEWPNKLIHREMSRRLYFKILYLRELDSSSYIFII